MINIKDYTYLGELGKGTYSVVNEYVHKKKKESIAVKNYTRKYDDLTFDIVREISMLKSINSDFIIPILAIDYENFDYVIFPKYDWHLGNFIKMFKLNTNEIMSVFNNICYGVYVLHCHGIIHRDLKPNNIMVHKKDGKYGFVIIDLGVSKYVEHYNIHKKLSPDIMTIWYRAPEVIAKSKYDFKVDVWSLGCILIELFTKKPLFNVEGEMELYLKQIQLMGSPKSKIYKKCKFEREFNETFSSKFKYLPKDIYNLSYKMLQIDPEKRIELYQCLNFYPSNKQYEPSFMIRDKYLDLYSFDIKYDKNRISPDITFDMRTILVDWLIEVSEDLNVSHVTYFQTIYILDSYLTQTTITKNLLQLVGITSLWIASKLLNVDLIEVDDLIKSTAYTYNQFQLVDMEKHMLRILEFKLTFPSPMVYFKRKIKKYCLDRQQYKDVLKTMYISTLHKDWIKDSPENMIINCIDTVLNSDIDIYFKNILEYYDSEKCRGIGIKFN